MRHLLFICSFFASLPAFGWGQYGHEQINRTALTLIADSTAIGQCLRSNERTLVRYAITPDLEWKQDQWLPTLSKALRKARAQADSCEHPLHFFELDAFVPNSSPHELTSIPLEQVLALPAHGDYSALVAQYQQRLAANRVYLLAVDPSKRMDEKVSVDDVAKHGTAPWRVLSLYKQAVQALKDRDLRRAFLYLGTIGHYVGDLAQPFHTTLDFDGGFYPLHEDQQGHYHAGIHHEIDTGLWPAPKKDADQIFVQFPLDRVLLSVAQKSNTEMSQPWTEAEMMKAIFLLSAQSYDLVRPLLSIYQSKCESAPILAEQRRPRRRVATANRQPSAYCHAVLPKGQKRSHMRALPRLLAREMLTARLPSGEAVADLLHTRLASASVLIARIWTSAILAAQAAPITCSAEEIKFDQAYAINNYPRPNYYPGGGVKGCPSRE